MASCKCKLCNRTLNTKVAYKVVEKKRNIYYCNYAHYEQFLKNKSSRISLINLIYELLDIKFKDGGAFINTRLKELTDSYSYEQIYKVTDEMSLDIQFAIDKLTNNSHKINYMFAMIKNKLFTLDDVQEQYKQDAMETIKVEDIKVEQVMDLQIKPRKQPQQIKQNIPQEVDFEIDF